MSISLRSNADGSGTLLNGATPVMEITAAGVVSLPNIAAGSSANQPVNLGQVIGVGQTWQDVKASRAANVTYTNNTGKPIFVTLYRYGTDNTGYGIEVDGVITGADTNIGSAYAIVPNGSTYKHYSNGTGTLTIWSELR